MFRVRTLEPKDFEFAVSLANTMNWRMTPEDFEYNRQLEPGGCFVLVDGEQLVGLATCISYGQIGWFGNLVVKETFRKHGAGTQLVQHAVDYLNGRGAKTIGLYAYLHLAGFYRRIGFEEDVDFSILSANSVTFQKEANENLKAAEAQDLPRIIAFDGQCFGAPREKLLDSFLRNPSNICFAAVDGSELTGFAAAKLYDNAAEIGPIECQRNKPQTAVNLLEKVLHRLNGFEAYLYLPSSEKTLMDTAVKAGFKQEFPLRRMFLGPKPAVTCIYSAESLERG